MNRKSFLKLTGTVLAGAPLASCVSSSVSGQPVAWPPTHFAKVKAFVYDCDADASVSFYQKDGRVTKGVINPEGALLTKQQVDRLIPTLTTATPRTVRTACFVPHHAFVFYDGMDRMVGYVDVCFTCAIIRSHPSGVPAHVDFTALWSILQDANIPLGDGAKFYQDLFRTTCKTR